MNRECRDRQSEVLEGTVSVREILAYLETDRFLSKRELSEYLNLSCRTLGKLLDGIPHYRLGNKLLFRKTEIDEWIQQFKEKTTTQDLDRIADEAVISVLEGGERWE